MPTGLLLDNIHAYGYRGIVCFKSPHDQPRPVRYFFITGESMTLQRKTTTKADQLSAVAVALSQVMPKVKR
jgi:hypothetical protein